jgi:hypothetical protein
VRERAFAISQAVPLSFAVNSAESYRALGAGLVVIRTERIAVLDALELVARQLIEAKRKLDAFRAQIEEYYKGAERRLDGALTTFKRAEDARVAAEAEKERRRREAEARAEAERVATAERERNAKEAAELAEQARIRRAEAEQALAAAEAAKQGDSSTEGLFGSSEGTVAESVIAEAEREIAIADQDLAHAQALASVEVPVEDVYVPPVVHAKTDLKVKGLRAKAAKWCWRLAPAAFRRAVREGDPISRLDLKNPDEIPSEYWVLDTGAMDSLVRGMKGRTSIPNLETWDENA